MLNSPRDKNEGLYRSGGGVPAIYERVEAGEVGQR